MGYRQFLHINYRSAKLLLQKICFAFKVEESRLLAFRELKASRSESTKPKVSKPIVYLNLGDQFDLKTYIESKVSKLNEKSLMKTFVSIHLYSRFLKCFQL